MQQDKQCHGVLAALRARAEVLQTGRVLDGRAFSGYLKAKARGLAAQRP
jgi:hypothetical protein